MMLYKKDFLILVKSYRGNLSMLIFLVEQILTESSVTTYLLEKEYLLYFKHLKKMITVLSLKQ